MSKVYSREEVLSWYVDYIPWLREKQAELLAQ